MKPYYQDKYTTIYHGDCLEILPETEKVDLVLTDPPYGKTSCKWDKIIPFNFMWKQLKRIRKINSAVVLFGSEPFSSALRMSNIEDYKYDWIWDKCQISNPFQAKIRPLTTHEIITVFFSHKYYPQYEILSSGDFRIRKNGRLRKDGKSVNGQYKQLRVQEKNKRFPKSILKISNKKEWDTTVHETQKPVTLMKYLIKTYSNESETVLDFTMGSGTTLFAAKQLNRKAIGIEIDEKNCETAAQRLSQEVLELCS